MESESGGESESGSGSGSESESEESASSEVKADFKDGGVDSLAADLTEEEKLVLDLLKKKSLIDLNELKGQTGLSNKKWDTAIKGLRANNLAKVEKTEEGLFVALV